MEQMMRANRKDLRTNPSSKGGDDGRSQTKGPTIRVMA